MGCGTEMTALPVLQGCPADTELILVSGAVGGVGNGRYALRKWGDLKSCALGAILPLVGVVGGGGADDPVAGLSTFTSTKLVGLGSKNNGRVQIVIDNVLQSNFGTNASFTLDNVAGTINIGPNVWVAGAGLFIDLNQ